MTSFQTKKRSKCYNDTINPNIFPAQSTYSRDFKYFCEARPARADQNKNRCEIKEKAPPAPNNTDYETHAFYKEGVTIPFNLYHQPKAILQTPPYFSFEIKKHPEDSKKEESIKTRPRIIMSPAVSLDDIENREERDKVCQMLYLTGWRRAEREAAMKVEYRETDTTYERSDRVRNETDIRVPLPEHWNRLGQKWEDHQMRKSVNPTEDFWIHKDPPMKCGACINPYKGLVSRETKDKIAELVAQNKLRGEHEKPSQTYTGTKPKFPGDIPWERLPVPRTHPFLSQNQAVYTDKFKSN